MSFHMIEGLRLEVRTLFLCGITHRKSTVQHCSCIKNNSFVIKNICSTKTMHRNNCFWFENKSFQFENKNFRTKFTFIVPICFPNYIHNIIQYAIWPMLENMDGYGYELDWGVQQFAPSLKQCIKHINQPYVQIYWTPF